MLLSFPFKNEVVREKKVWLLFFSSVCLFYSVLLQTKKMCAVLYCEKSKCDNNNTCYCGSLCSIKSSYSLSFKWNSNTHSFGTFNTKLKGRHSCVWRNKRGSTLQSSVYKGASRISHQLTYTHGRTSWRGASFLLAQKELHPMTSLQYVASPIAREQLELSDWNIVTWWTLINNRRCSPSLALVLIFISFFNLHLEKKKYDCLWFGRSSFFHRLSPY